MMKQLSTHIFKYAVLITSALILYFLAMVGLGLEHNFNLRMLNASFLFGGIFLAVRELKNKTFDTSFGYFSGLGTGVFISIFTAIFFATFMGLYLAARPEFLAEIQATEPQGIYMNEVGLSLLVFIEALASGILFSYSVMQLLKSRRLSASASTIDY